MLVSEFLTDTRRVIERPANWTQGKSQENFFNNDLNCHSTRFCMSGVLDYSQNRVRRFREQFDLNTYQVEDIYRKAQRYVEQAIPENYYSKARPSIIEFNDHSGRQHADILAVFDLAIARAKQDEYYKARRRLVAAAHAEAIGDEMAYWGTTVSPVKELTSMKADEDDLVVAGD